MTITNKAPYEHVPAFPSPSPSDSIATTMMNQPRPLSTFIPSSDQQQRQQSAIFNKESAELAEPLNRTWSEPYAKDSATKLPGKGARVSQIISDRSEKRRLSKKEKKFQLSKDDGSYAELKPVDPHDARKEFGNTLKLNPVGPAFQAAAAAVGHGGAELGDDDDHVTTAHNVVESEGNLHCRDYVHVIL